MSRPPRREAVAGPRGGKAIDQWRAPPTAQAGCPAYGEPIGAKKFLFPPFFIFGCLGPELLVRVSHR